MSQPLVILEIFILHEIAFLDICRVPHGARFTRGFQAMGHTVTVTVPDFDNRRQTVPFTAVSWYCTYTASGPGLTSDVDLAPPKHSYVFCQMISPVVSHGGGPCTCYDVGK